MTVGASNYARQQNDLYQTEPWATRALIKHFPVAGKTVWEAAAGNHLMADVLRDAGADVVTSDVETYDRRHDAIMDFLEPRFSYRLPKHNSIITNPPYGRGNRIAVKFCNLALERCDGLVAMLLTAKFDFGKTRLHLTRDNPRFAAKIALVDRIQWFPGDSTGTEDHAWYVWRGAGDATSPPVMLYAGKEDA
ncbi:hypothetical protein FPY71_10185 [Aureimonas fodinaquatilis]|uniref:SAM-dependent methyltransferase n=1 Tax=Aureimonas fodinaquatilis TaxID=2565783 RepID=A0A5B0DY82_9HYPH|nr:hypothetical protein [Aureimonas fodinaquatilis]KAA0970835.1 hypothetical protein FPY71_10185 [Aureimonas fodinaquatilis]